MAATGNPKVGFVGWNPFQFLHYGGIVSMFSDATFVVEERKAARKSFDLESLPGAPARVMRCGRREMRSLDGVFDVLVCQTVFSGIEEIRESKIAMLQYGYAKEAHNFAPWRSFADVCMTYGAYASRKIEPFCHCVATGNPRFEPWDDESFHSSARSKYADRLNPDRKTVLFAPTWGALSSCGRFADAVLALSGQFNVILKIHHLTQRDGGGGLASIGRKFGVVHGADDDIVELLSVSDVMISDFSGAIFDAIQGEVPVVLLGPANPDGGGGSKSDPYSIEQARRNELGEVVDAAGDLAGAVHRALDGTPHGGNGLAEMRSDLFADAKGACARAAAVIGDLSNGGFRPTQSQEYIRREMVQLHRCRSDFTLLRQARRWLGIGGQRP